jgi:VCBS repeat-containing protein
VSDTHGNISNTGTVNISVTTTNQFPVADSGSWTTNEDASLVATLSGSDPEGVPLTFVLDQNVTHGTLSLSATGGFIYTPNANYNGSDTFTFHVSDGVLNSSIELVTLTISPMGDAPLAVADTFS